MPKKMYTTNIVRVFFVEHVALPFTRTDYANVV